MALKGLQFVSLGPWLSLTGATRLSLDSTSHGDLRALPSPQFGAVKPLWAPDCLHYPLPDTVNDSGGPSGLHASKTSAAETGESQSRRATAIRFRLVDPRHSHTGQRFSPGQAAFHLLISVVRSGGGPRSKASRRQRFQKSLPSNCCLSFALNLESRRSRRPRACMPPRAGNWARPLSGSGYGGHRPRQLLPRRS